MKKITAIAAIILLIATLTACNKQPNKGLELPNNWPTTVAPIHPSGVILNHKEIGSDQTQDKTSWIEYYVEQDYDQIIDFYKDKMQNYSDYNLNYDDYDGDRLSTITALSEDYSIKVNISAKQQENFSNCIVDIYLSKP